LNVVPVEVWFFDYSTGTILTKFESKKEEIAKKPQTAPQKPLGPPTKCPPAIIEQPEPHYTEEARVKQVTGTVTLSAVFKETGEISDITVINSLPNGLTEKAIEAAKGIKYLSPIVGGKKIPSRMTLDFNFNLY
jgi:TonB family protein